jgi:hypothetical protein
VLARDQGSRPFDARRDVGARDPVAAFRAQPGVARGPRLLRRGPGEHRLDRAAGGGAEQVKRTACGHVTLPGDERGREFAGIDPAGEQQAAEQDSLLGVVGDRPGGHPGRDRMPGRGRLEPGEQRSPQCGDLPPAQQLRGHAERITDRQTIQGTSSSAN